MPATPAWPPRSAPRLFVPGPLIAGQQVLLAGNQANYLSRVMRAKEGDIAILCDNITGEWAAAVSFANKREVGLEITKHLRPREEVPDFWLCPALLKKDRFDLVLEKATELGVSKIQPIITRRCVADKLNLERARAIATEAAEQCTRTALPEIAPPVKLPALLANWPEQRPLFFADEAGGGSAAAQFSAGGTPAALMIGPEGGFDDPERNLLRHHAAVKPITLGPRILRGETAAITGISLWMGMMGDW